MEKLFLIKPDFYDTTRNTGKKYICPPCTLIEGLLSFYPHLREKLDIQYVDFVRPRRSIIELIGEENQSCPVLILPDGKFYKDTDKIIDYLAKKYGTGFSH